MKSKKKISPPKAANWILSGFFSISERELIISDLEEQFIELAGNLGKNKAALWYWDQVFKAVKGRLFNKFLWSFEMIRNYMKIAVRNILKNKAYSLINISGLALGLASCVLVMLYIDYEKSTDEFHKNFDTIFRIDRKELSKNGWKPWVDVSGQTGEWMAQDYPEIRAFTRVKSLPFYNFKVSFRNNYIKESLIEAVDPSYFDIFTFPMIRGSKETALAEPNSVLMTEDFAQRLFNKEEPMGKIITISSEQEDRVIEYDLKVTGILENIPENSHSSVTLVVPLEFAERVYFENGVENDFYGSNGFVTYVLLNEHRSGVQLENKMDDFVSRRFGEDKVGIKVFTLKHLGKIYSFGTTEYKMTMFSIIALIILMVACINYMNLSTARSFSRAREIGIRKVVGAGKLQLIVQFIGEAIVFAFIGLAAAYILAQVLLPVFNVILQKNISITFENTSGILLQTIIMAMAAGIISGIYPAVFLSNFKPVKALKGNLKIERKRFSFRNILVVFQYSVSIFFIISSLVMNKQFNFFTTKELGFNTDNILVVKLDSAKPLDFMENLKSGLVSDREIESVSYATSIPYESFRRLPKDPRLNVKNFLARAYGVPIIYCDSDYLRILGIDIENGSDFSPGEPSNNYGSLVINNAALYLLGENDPIIPGRQINLKIEENRFRDFIVQGITGDIYFTVRYFDVEPVLFSIASPGQKINYNYILVKTRTGITDEAAAMVNRTISEISPEAVFECSFFDEEVNATYKRDSRWKQIFGIISGIALFITSLGMIGMSTYSCEQRISEVGIRKVLGGTVPGIIGLLSRQFLLLVATANVIAIPLSIFYMRNYLNSFAYQTNIGIETIATGIFISIILTLFTIFIQITRAAFSDPVKTLRYE